MELQRHQVSRLLEGVVATFLAHRPATVDSAYLEGFLQRQQGPLIELLLETIGAADLQHQRVPDLGEHDCPFCGEVRDFDGLDVRFDPITGERWVDWFPCCYSMRDAIAELGWEEVFGVSLEESLQLFALARDVRHVDLEDSLILASLSVWNPGPGTKGWQARVFRDIRRHHLHHPPPQGWKFGVGVWNGTARVGVAVVGRPVSRMIQESDPGVLEVTRICTWGDSRLRRNAVTKLLGQCRKEARKLGATRLISYTLEDEAGSSMKAAGFEPVAVTKGGSWDRPGRRRTDTAPTGRKVRWEAVL